MNSTISITVDVDRILPVSEENIFKYLWEARGAYIQSVIDGGETSLSRTLAALADHSRHHSLELQKVPLNGTEILTGRASWVPTTTNPTDRTLYPETALLPTGQPAYAYALVNNQVIVRPFHAELDNAPVRFLLDHLHGRDFDAIVEIGSGLGEKLFKLYLNGGPRDAAYFGAELWQEGRQIADRLAQLEPGLNFTSVPFDLNQPDFSFLAGYKRVLIFSNAALYTVTTLPQTLMECMANAAPHVEGVHFEFVGHQRPAAPGEDRTAAYRDECRKRGFNTNFVDLVDDAQARGFIHSLFVGLDQFSNSSNQLVSLICWQADHATRTS